MPYEPKTKAELKQALVLDKALENERNLNDRKYAIKLVERIVFAAMGVIALYFLNKALGIFTINIPQ